MVGLSVSMRMFPIWPYLNSIDRFSMFNMIIITFVMLAFVIFVAQFALFRVKKLVTLKTTTKKEKHKDLIDNVREQFMEKTLHETKHRKNKRFRK